jgi:hypothetical protein
MQIRVLLVCAALAATWSGAVAHGAPSYATYIANPIATLPIGVQEPTKFLWVGQYTAGTGEPLINDNGTGHNAWQIADEQATFPAVGNPSYVTALSASASTAARTSGFRFEAFARFIDDFNDGPGMGLSVFLNQRAYHLMLDLDDGDLRATLFGGATKTLTSGRMGTAAYHRFALQSSGGTGVTALFDGQPIGPAWTGISVAAAHPDIAQFGNSGEARANRGAMAFRDVVFELSPTTPIAGDFDGDSDADGRDFLRWQRTLESRVDLSADASSDRVVNSADLAVWRSAFRIASPSSHQTPEPTTTSSLIALIAPALGIGERIRRSSRDA